jgi:hypothetical protein
LEPYYIGENHKLIMQYTQKNDLVELTEIGQFLRDSFPNVIVRIEWAILYNGNDEYKGYSKLVYTESEYKFRTPDIMLINKKTKKLLGCIEIDGSIHTVHLDDTWARNQIYTDLGINLKVVTKETLETSIFDAVYKYATEICKEGSKFQ